MMGIHTKSRQTTFSLTTTLALAFITLSAVVLLISSGLQLFANIQAQRQLISSKQQLIAHDASRTVSSFIQEKFSVLETAVELSNPVTMSPAEQQQIIVSLLGPQLAFRQLIMLNTQGQELAQGSRISLAAARRSFEQAKGDILTQIKQNKRYISSVYIDSTNNEPLVLIAVPATNALGDLQGALVAEVNLKFMWDVVDRLKVGETGHAYVVDRQGKLLAFSDTVRVLKGENVSRLQAVSAFIQSPAGAAGDPTTTVSTYPGITGVMVVGAYVPLETPDWAVVTELPETEAYREVIQQAIVSIGVTVAMAVLAGLLGVFVARRLAVPLINLTGAATRITAGELAVQAAVGGPREVASLARAFNSMTAQLRQTLAGLEQRVADRTSDLQRALDEVEARAHEQERLLAENQQQREMIREMSVPVLPVTDSTLVMPLVGVLDTERLRLLQDQALQAIERSRAQTLILDITAVPIVDSQVAQGLVMVVQAARLLGTEVLLVGVRAEVAQTMVGLGLSLTGLRTYNDLQGALSRRSMKHGVSKGRV
jgi:anti-anti-sigma regulatory factor/HAMP domain-containing protein